MEDDARTARVTELAFRDEIEEMPDVTEIIAGRECRIGHAQQLPTRALEDRDAGHPAFVATVAHVGREGRALTRHHGEFPMAAVANFRCVAGSSGEETTK